MPAVAAAIVAWATLGSGGARVRYVQVLGGPTSALSSLLIRGLELERDGRVLPLPGLALRAQVRSGGATAAASGVTDVTGHVELRFDRGASLVTSARFDDAWLRVETGTPAETLAEGHPSLDAERWRAGARRSGGWLAGQARGALQVRAAVESGTFAVPFASALMVQVLETGDAGAGANAGSERAITGATLELELDGAALVEAPPVTAASGLSRVTLRPEEHAVSARIVARAGERHGEWYGVLPVRPGALVASREGAELWLRSPIVRERAFVSIVSWSERIGGAIVPLEPRSDGSASGRLPLDSALLARIEREPSWVVVSSEYDKRSAGAVGWPLSPAGFDPGAPPLSLDVADTVLLDGRAEAIVAAELERSGRRRGAALALLGVGLVLSASFWREVRRGKRAASTPADASAERPPLSPNGWLFAVALVSIVLGWAGLAYFGLSH